LDFNAGATAIPAYMLSAGRHGIELFIEWEC